MMTWYVRTKQGARGPIEFQQIREMVAAGQLKQNHALWKPGMTDWQIASNIPGLFRAEKAKEFRAFEQPAIQENAFEKSHLSDSQISQGFQLWDYASRHWQGKLSLVKSAWINGVLLSLIVGFLLTGLSELLFDEYLGARGKKLVVYAVLAFIVLQVLQAVGIFRAATVHIRKRLIKVPTWAGIARIYSILLATNVLATFLELVGVQGA